MCIFEYDEEKQREEWHTKGRTEGEDRAFRLMQYLTDKGKMAELNRAMSDREYREQLFREYNL